MQLQQDNSSSISNIDVTAVLKQSLQSLESFKQEVQMLKEAKDNVRPTLTSPACHNFLCLRLLNHSYYSIQPPKQVLKTLKRPEPWNYGWPGNKCVAQTVFSSVNIICQVYFFHIMIVRVYCCISHTKKSFVQTTLGTDRFFWKPPPPPTTMCVGLLIINTHTNIYTYIC